MSTPLAVGGTLSPESALANARDALAAELRDFAESLVRELEETATQPSLPGDVTPAQWARATGAVDDAFAGAERRMADGPGGLVRLGVLLAEAAVKGTVDALDVLYDGHPWDIVLGAPLEAGAYRAAVESPENGRAAVRHVAGEDGDDEPLTVQLKLPVAAVMTEMARRLKAAATDEQNPTLVPEGMSLPQFWAWRKAWVTAAYKVAHHMADRQDEAELEEMANNVANAQRREAARLSPVDLLFLMAAETLPRGFAANDRYVTRRLEAIKVRLQRRVEKFSRAVSE